MIEIGTGSILDADTDAIVNPVNCVGVMGKGLALAVRRRWPEVYKSYQIACDLGRMRPGWVHVVQRRSPPSFVINLATKNHWRGSSNLEWIEAGMQHLVVELALYKISSVAIPALGCGLGGLPWTVVEPVIRAAVAELPVRTVLFGPQA